jgi:hypothetical protein
MTLFCFKDMTDTGSYPDSGQLSQLRQLRVELERLHTSGQLDPYTLYVYGVVLRKLALHDLALTVLCESIQGRGNFFMNENTIPPLHLLVFVLKY